jgi:hypothetical protein
MTKSNFERYASLKAQIKALQAEVEELAPTLIDEMDSEAMDEAIIPNVGTFYFKERRIWTYPEELVAFETQLKADKKTAQQKGSATCDIMRDLTFRGVSETSK